MKCVIVILNDGDRGERRAEIELLCRTVGYEVKEVFTQASPPRPRFLIGRGKVMEVREYVAREGIDLVVFENYLTSRQLMSLEGEIGVPVIDKFDLILNVFEAHARSREAMLQIELARLKRKLPYIKMQVGQRVREDHPGFGGSGEYIVHSTLAEIQKRIKKIQKKLRKFEWRVELQGNRRREKGKVISLVGYTNVGKTTLLNTLTKAGKPARDELFTTLSPKAASLQIDGEKVFINDTLGFMRNLPHELIYAFRAALREITASDLILVVLDISEPLEEFRKKKEIVEEALVKIGAHNIPTLYVLNKADLVDRIEAEKIVDNAVVVSAREGMGIDALKKEVLERLG
jgi:GTP-binding protein HflX